MAKFERVEEIDVTPDKVWKVIITPDVWDEWMPGITGISGAGPAVVGSSYPYQAGDKTGKATRVVMDVLAGLCGVRRRLRDLCHGAGVESDRKSVV